MKQKIERKEKKQLLAYMSERFGLSESVFAGYSFFKTKRKHYICTSECLRDELFSKAETAGIAFARPNKQLKPTTDMLQIFGADAKKNFIELSKEDAEGFIRGEDIKFEGRAGNAAPTDKTDQASHAEAEIEEGYIIVKFNSKVLGCANLSQGFLKNLVPRSRRLRVKL